MELVEGQALSARLGDSPLRPTRSCATAQLTDAVAYAHEHGVCTAT